MGNTAMSVQRANLDNCIACKPVILWDAVSCVLLIMADYNLTGCQIADLDMRWEKRIPWPG